MTNGTRTGRCEGTTVRETVFCRKLFYRNLLCWKLCSSGNCSTETVFCRKLFCRKLCSTETSQETVFCRKYSAGNRVLQKLFCRKLCSTETVLQETVFYRNCVLQEIVFYRNCVLQEIVFCRKLCSTETVLQETVCRCNDFCFTFMATIVCPAESFDYEKQSHGHCYSNCSVPQSGSN